MGHCHRWHCGVPSDCCSPVSLHDFIPGCIVPPSRRTFLHTAPTHQREATFSNPAFVCSVWRLGWVRCNTAGCSFRLFPIQFTFVGAYRLGNDYCGMALYHLDICRLRFYDR